MKEKLKVVFLVMRGEAVWKMDALYQKMLNDQRFEPVVVIYPHSIHTSEEQRALALEKTHRFFLDKGYEVVLGISGFNLKEELKPDLIIFNDLHVIGLPVHPIMNCLDTLSCYIPYGVMSSNHQYTQYNQPIHMLVWKHFVETSVHKDMARKYSINAGSNVDVIGSPLGDLLLQNHYATKSVWKSTSLPLKRVIWAPHHSINEIPKFSNFLEHSEFMLSLAKRYQHKIQISFKPHPTLKKNLYKHKDWGPENTQLYYSRWANLENGQLDEGDYIDLFLSSDAMIFDSMSFMTEYLYTGKPSLFVLTSNKIKDSFNEYGKLVFEKLYQAKNTNDIEVFFDKIVFGVDERRAERQVFFNNFFLPHNNQSATNNIFDVIENELKIKKN